MIILQKNTPATPATPATESGYPSVTELMAIAKSAIDVVMTTPSDGYAEIGQICPDVARGHVSRSTVLAAFKHAIDLVNQIKTHDAAAAGAVLEVLETVQAALKAPLTLGTKPPEAAAPATEPAKPEAPAQSEAAQTVQAELNLETEAPATPAKPEVHIVKAKKAKA